MNRQKIDELRKWMGTEEIGLTYISNPEHISYLSGYTSNPHERISALFIFLEQAPFLFTPALEAEEAQNSSWEGAVYSYLDSEDPWAILEQLIKQRKEPKKIALEKGYVTITRFEHFQNHFPVSDCSTDVTPIIEKLKLRKTTNEITKLRAAGNWADTALSIGFNEIKQGKPEQEIVAEIDYQLKKRGISSMSFDTLVLTGLNTANPHGTPGKTTIQSHNLVLFDLGVIHNGYCSDVTRTVAYKEPTDNQKQIHSIVLEAQQAALEAIKPGITAGELDAIARNVITRAGYGEYFTHRLGHGIGMGVHEFPSLVTGSDLVIEEGMCFSIEPGIYIPNKVGVRIEDCVCVTATGHECFTQTSRELRIMT